jgi:hypothetical protein
MFDSVAKYWKEITGIVSLIILGAIGTALWEVVLKPSSSWLLRKFLSVTTFGLDRAKNNIYKKIAPGQEESFSKFIAFYFAILFSITLIIVMITFKSKVIEGFKVQHDKLISMEKEIEKFINPEKEPSISDKSAKLKQDVLQLRTDINELKGEVIKIERYANIFYIISIIGVIYLIIMVWSEFLMLVYINNAIRYFNQLVRICAPFMDKAERLNILSEFSRITSPRGYMELIERLKKIATEHEFNVPGFWVWGYKE